MANRGKLSVPTDIKDRKMVSDHSLLDSPSSPSSDSMFKNTVKKSASVYEPSKITVIGSNDSVVTESTSPLIARTRSARIPKSPQLSRVENTTNGTGAAPTPHGTLARQGSISTSPKGTRHTSNKEPVSIDNANGSPSQRRVSRDDQGQPRPASSIDSPSQRRPSRDSENSPARRSTITRETSPIPTTIIEGVSPQTTQRRSVVRENSATAKLPGLPTDSDTESPIAQRRSIARQGSLGGNPLHLKTDISELVKRSEISSPITSQRRSIAREGTLSGESSARPKTPLPLTPLSTLLKQTERGPNTPMTPSAENPLGTKRRVLKSDAMDMPLNLKSVQNDNEVPPSPGGLEPLRRKTTRNTILSARREPMATSPDGSEMQPLRRRDRILDGSGELVKKEKTSRSSLDLNEVPSSPTVEKKSPAVKRNLRQMVAPITAMLRVQKDPLRKEVEKVLAQNELTKKSVPAQFHPKQVDVSHESLEDDEEEDVYDTTGRPSKLKKGASHESIPILESRSKVLRAKFKSVLYGVRFARQRDHKNSIHKKFFDMPFFDPNASVMSILKTHQVLPDYGLTSSLKELLDKPRTKDVIEQIDTLLKLKLRSLQRFSLDQRNNIYKLMTLSEHEPNLVIVREGHISSAFYFILNGQVQIYKDKDGKRMLLNTLNSGESFGDRTMNMLNDKRMATVVTTTTTQFLVILKADFFEIVSARDQKELPYILTKMSQIPLFQVTIGNFLENIARQAHVIQYDSNQAIITEGRAEGFLYWIIQGTCKVSKLVPFIKKTAVSGKGKKFALKPCSISTVTSDPSEERVNETLSLRSDMEPGDYFPAITDQFSGQANGTGEHINATYTITSNTKVELIMVRLSDFLGLAPREMLARLANDNRHILKFDLSELQNAYIERINWEQYRQKVVDEIVH